MVRKFSILCFVLALAALTAAAQDDGRPRPRYATRHDPELAERLVKAAKEKHPQWRIRRKASGGHMTVIDWEQGGQIVRSEVYRMASPEDAAQQMEWTLSMPLPSPRAYRALAGLGDEARMAVGGKYHKKGETTLFFRKGSAFVVIDASSPGVAQSFARNIAGELGDN